MLVRLIALGALACAPEVSDNVGTLRDPAGTFGQGSAVIRDTVRPVRPALDYTPPALGTGEVDTGEPDPVDDGPQLLADSVAGFSDTQGANGWYYGYLEPDGANTFVEMPSYVAGGTDPGWYAALGGVYWTMMDASTMHPNGVVTTGGRQPVEQWAVRRWVSDVEGDVEITGHFAKLSVDGNSNGVAGYVFVDGAMDWAWYLEGWDNGGVDLDKVLSVHVGSTVDFVLDPWNADDRSDRSTFTAQIWSVPAE